jgi:hypothetical protein
MKFYLKNKKNNLTKIINYKLTAIYYCDHIFFLKMACIIIIKMQLLYTIVDIKIFF